MTENDKSKQSEQIDLYPTFQQHNAQLPHLYHQPSAPPVSAPGTERHSLHVENPPPYSITDPLQPQLISHTSLLNEPVRTIQPSNSFNELRRASLHDYLSQRNALVHPLPSPTVSFGTVSVRRKCPYCRRTMMTMVTRSPNMCTYLSSLMLCCVGLNCGCCLIPFCIDFCNDIEHRCSVCDGYLGRHNGL